MLEITLPLLLGNTLSLDQPPYMSISNGTKNGHFMAATGILQYFQMG